MNLLKVREGLRQKAKTAYKAYVKEAQNGLYETKTVLAWHDYITKLSRLALYDVGDYKERDQ